MVASNWPYLLEPGLRQIFYVQTEALVAQSPVPQLFNVTDSSKAVEHVLGVGGFGDVLPFNGRIEYDAFDPGFKTDIPHIEYTDALTVQRRLMDDDQYNVIARNTQMLATAFARTTEKHGASVFTNAFNTTDLTGLYQTPVTGKKPLGADLLPLCSTVHPINPANPTITQSNAGSLPLTYDNIIATRKTMRRFVDDRGQLRGIEPDTLLVGPELEDQAYTIMNSMNRPGTANNDVNYVRGQGLIRQVIVWRYMNLPSQTGNAWFLIDSEMAKMHLWWFNRIPLQFDVDPAANYNLQANFRGYTRFGYGWDDPYFVYGNTY